MATLLIRLEIDPVTQKKNVWVKYESDADALPMEHEEQHKRLVEALVKGGTVKAEELGTLTIEREGAGATPKPNEAAQVPEQREPVGNKR